MKSFSCESCEKEFSVSEMKERDVGEHMAPIQCCTWCAVKPAGVEKLGKCKTCGEMTTVLTFEFEPTSLMHNECLDCSLKKIGLT